MPRWQDPIVSTAIMFFGFRMGDALSLLNSIVLGRWLGQAEFGQASALLNALSVLAVAIAVVICREAVWMTDTKDYQSLLRCVWRWFGVLAGVGIVCGVLVVVLGSVFQSMFRFKHDTVRYAYATTVAVTIMFPLWTGVLQGQRRFVVLSMGPLIQGAVRIAASMVLIRAGFELAGAIIAPAMAMLILMAWCMFWVHRVPRGETAEPPVACVPSARPSLLTMFLNDLTPLIALAALLSMDVIVVNYLLPNDTGGFAAVSTIGKLTFYLPQGIVVTLLPHVMRASMQGRSSLKFLLLSVAATALVSGAIIWLLYRWHAPIMHAYRKDFAFYGGYLPRYTVAMGLFSVVTITTNYAMACGIRRIGYYLLALVPVQLYLYYTSSGSLQSLVDRTVIVAFLAMVGSILLLVTQKGEKRSDGATT